MRIALATFAMALVIDGCSTKTCTTAGCNDDVTATFELDRPVRELGGGSIRVCRNEDCGITRIDTSEAGLPDVFHCTGTSVSCTGDVRGNRLRVVLVVPGFGAPARDGEVFDVVLSGPNGDVIASRRGTVDYTVNRPNGPECEPTCRQGELK